jgi:hypothetical protein
LYCSHPIGGSAVSRRHVQQYPHDTHSSQPATPGSTAAGLPRNNNKHSREQLLTDAAFICKDPASNVQGQTQQPCARLEAGMCKDIMHAVCARRPAANAHGSHSFDLHSHGGNMMHLGVFGTTQQHPTAPSTYVCPHISVEPDMCRSMCADMSQSAPAYPLCCYALIWKHTNFAVRTGCLQAFCRRKKVRRDQVTLWAPVARPTHRQYSSRHRAAEGAVHALAAYV